MVANLMTQNIEHKIKHYILVIETTNDKMLNSITRYAGF